MVGLQERTICMIDYCLLHAMFSFLSKGDVVPALSLERGRKRFSNEKGGVSKNHKYLIWREKDRNDTECFMQSDFSCNTSEIVKS